MVAQVSLKKLILQQFEHTAPPKPRYLTALELKGPNPAPPVKGTIEEKPGPHAPSIAGHG